MQPTHQPTQQLSKKTKRVVNHKMQLNPHIAAFTITLMDTVHSLVVQPQSLDSNPAVLEHVTKMLILGKRLRKAIFQLTSAYLEVGKQSQDQGQILTSMVGQFRRLADQIEIDWEREGVTRYGELLIQMPVLCVDEEAFSTIVGFVANCMTQRTLENIYTVQQLRMLNSYTPEIRMQVIIESLQRHHPGMTDDHCLHHWGGLSNRNKVRYLHTADHTASYPNWLLARIEEIRASSEPEHATPQPLQEAARFLNEMHCSLTRYSTTTNAGDVDTVRRFLIRFLDLGHYNTIHCPTQFNTVTFASMTSRFPANMVELVLSLGCVIGQLDKLGFREDRQAELVQKFNDRVELLRGEIEEYIHTQFLWDTLRRMCVLSTHVLPWETVQPQFLDHSVFLKMQTDATFLQEMTLTKGPITLALYMLELRDKPDVTFQCQYTRLVEYENMVRPFPADALCSGPDYPRLFDQL